MLAKPSPSLANLYCPACGTMSGRAVQRDNGSVMTTCVCCWTSEAAEPDIPASVLLPFVAGGYHVAAHPTRSAA